MVETDLPLLLCTLDQVLYVLYTHICYYVYYARIYSIAYTVYRLLSSCQVRIAKGQQNCKRDSRLQSNPSYCPFHGVSGEPDVGSGHSTAGRSRAGSEGEPRQEAGSMPRSPWASPRLPQPHLRACLQPSSGARGWRILRRARSGARCPGPHFRPAEVT